jgi:ribose-phosphate pyrophosphokinase
MNDKLGLIVLNNCKELGTKVNEHLKKMNKRAEDYIIPIEQVRFTNGEGKIVIKETIREKNIFVLSDVGNYSCTYHLFDVITNMAPDSHFQDIKRVISAMSGNASKLSVIMPYLYASRQHKRKGRESLDCAIALQELERLGVKSIITFDAHDPNVQNAIPCLSFENFYATHILLEKFIKEEDIDFNNLVVASPDAGAMDRARYYADMLNCDAGMFYKRRDLSIIVDGRNPIVAHEFLGKDIEGKDVILVDDMIASGDSILEVIEEVHKRKARNVYIFCTFAWFSKGIEKFNQIYKENKIKRLYTTNLSYVPEEAKKTKWLKQADCSLFLAKIINTLYHQGSISPLLNGKKEILKKIEEKYNE